VLRTEPDAIMLSGDIAEAPGLTPFLEKLELITEAVRCIYARNHDCYKSSIRAVRGQVKRLCKASGHCHYLSADTEFVALTPLE
jgi:hypothetical protein